jgi:polysaccharide biosynthesis transport protein
MKINDILRLLRKNAILLIVVPMVLGITTKFLVKDTFTSRTTLYTGLTSGTNVQLDQSFNLFTSNAGFDNLINVFQSRETSEEVALRLLAMHLMMERPDPKYISSKSFLALQEMTPLDIRKLVVHKRNPIGAEISIPESSNQPSLPDNSFSEKTDFTRANKSGQLIPSLDPDAYELTLRNLIAYRKSNDTNFLVSLLGHSDAHYSISAISGVMVQRVGSGDLIELSYTTNDPGICQHTLRLITMIGIRNYMRIKEDRSDSVVKYFEQKVSDASGRLMTAENQLQDFEKKNNIINYDEQSRDISKITGNLESVLQSKRNKLAADYAAIKAVEQKLGNNERIQIQNSSLLEKRNQLSGINAQILMLEASGFKDSATVRRLGSLKQTASTLNEEISNSVSEIYDASKSTGGAPDNNLVNSWITSTRDYEETRNDIEGLEKKLASSQRLYQTYVPAGVTLKRLEREIAVSEKEYLEAIHSLNLAKLKLQDVELSSSIRAVDSPFFPTTPDPGKRMVMIALAAVVGFLLVFSIILLLEYFDDTLNNPGKAIKILNLDPVGIFPRIPEKIKVYNYPYITDRLLEMMIQEIDMFPKSKTYHSQTHPRTILFFSTLSKEGKSFVVSNIARKLKMQGKKVRVITFSGEDLLEKKLAITEEHIGQFMTPINEPYLNGRDPDTNTPAQLMEYIDETPESNKEITSRPSLTLEIPETAKKSEEHIIFQVDDRYCSIKNYRELLQLNNTDSITAADYTLIELPPILSFPYPTELVASVDLAILVCRSTRSWSEADQGALSTLMRLNRRHPMFLLNGVNLHVVKSSIGKLPKIRRRKKKSSKGAETVSA